ncbi:uncharacterized protein LOC130453121 [Diorhabda sublineata]|uniref:uncharacterized protein LOC130453121 n=1 Tax=Diorhabda sublineata TaxID=1163346 RepID=UPI0024E0C3A4|nr:uncharacterized protein LOC130453121 [Diorhabda sublineata]
MVFEQLISQWPQQKQFNIPDQTGLFQSELPTESNSITSQHPFVFIQAESATTQNSFVDVDRAMKTSETIEEILPSTTETLSSIYTSIRDALTTTQNSLVTELQDKSTISLNVTSNSFSTEDISNTVTTETSMLVTSNYSEIFTVSQTSSTDLVTDNNLNLTKMITTTSEAVSNSFNVFTDEMSTTKSILDNVNGTSTDGIYHTTDDTCWIYYVIIGVLIGILVIFAVGVTFFYNMKQRKRCPEYEVSQIQQISVD